MSNMDGEIRLLTAIIQQPEPPCTKQQCVFRVTCRERSLACSAFIGYVFTGNSKSRIGIPSTSKYQFLFPTRNEVAQ